MLFHSYHMQKVFLQYVFFYGILNLLNRHTSLDIDHTGKVCPLYVFGCEFSSHLFGQISCHIPIVNRFG